jgi:hypothetical protein
MELYGNLIAKLIMEDQKKAWDEVIRDIDWATNEITGVDAYHSDTEKAKEIREKYGLKD